MKSSTQVRLEDQNQPQQQRLFYLEFRLYFLGGANRRDLQVRFGLKESSASRDIALYKKLAPNNMVYDYNLKSYVLSDAFQPIFSYTATQVFAALTYGFGDDYSIPKSPEISTESPCETLLPAIDTLAVLSRAIHGNEAVVVRYLSPLLGRRVQELVPHSFINSGSRWMVRAYDRSADTFCDFVLNRIEECLGAGRAPEVHELKEVDERWNTISEMTLVPHPTVQFPEAIQFEFAMHEGALKMTCRESLKGYLLEQWRVDVSSEPSAEVGRYEMWLKS